MAQRQTAGMIVAGEDEGGFRDFLAGDPIHTGDELEISAGGHWIPGRYDMDVHTRQGFFTTSIFDPFRERSVSIPIDREVMFFRWPPRRWK